jgi:hypothetical protein
MKNAPRQRIFLHSTADCCFFHWQQGPAAMSSSSSPQSTSNWTCIAVAAAMKYLASTSSLLAHYYLLPSAFQSRRSEGYISPDCTLPLSSSSSSSPSPFPPQNSTHTHTNKAASTTYPSLKFSPTQHFPSLIDTYLYLPLYSTPCTLAHTSYSSLSRHPNSLLTYPFSPIPGWFDTWEKEAIFLMQATRWKTPHLWSVSPREARQVWSNERAVHSPQQQTHNRRETERWSSPAPICSQCAPKVLQVLYALPYGLIALSSIRVLRKFHSCFFFFFFLGSFLTP